MRPQTIIDCCITVVHAVRPISKAKRENLFGLSDVHEQGSSYVLGDNGQQSKDASDAQLLVPNTCGWGGTPMGRWPIIRRSLGPPAGASAAKG